MSEENVEIMRAALDAYARADIPDLLRFLDPEIRFEPQLAALEGSYLGHDGIREFFTDALETLELLRFDYPDVRDLGDRVLALGTFSLGGMGSGAETGTPLAVVATFRQGRITHLKDFGDVGRALEAVGLRE